MFSIVWQYHFLWYYFVREGKPMKTFLFKYLISRVYNLIFSAKIQSETLNFKPTDRCLLLAGKTEDIFSGLGGSVIKNSDKFSVYSLTNGFREIIDNAMTYEEKVDLRKKEFHSAIEKANIGFGEFFEDVDQGRLIMRYDKFKSIIISNYDYIFVPNLLEPDKDNKSIAIMLNELLKERPYKKHAKIILYEVASTLPMPNCFIDIEDVLDKKLEIINGLNQKGETGFSENIKCLNKFRGAAAHRNYAEALCVLSIEEFKKVCKLYM